MPYVVKLNPTDKRVESSEPEWLTKFSNVFCEELLELPPKHEVDHSIEFTPSVQSIAKTKKENFRPDNSTFLRGGPSGANFNHVKIRDRKLEPKQIQLK